jgi:hypothetical protein
MTEPGSKAPPTAGPSDRLTDFVREVSVIFGTRLQAIALSGIAFRLPALAAEASRVINDCR